MRVAMVMGGRTPLKVEKLTQETVRSIVVVVVVGLRKKKDLAALPSFACVRPITVAIASEFVWQADR